MNIQLSLKVKKKYKVKANVLFVEQSYDENGKTNFDQPSGDLAEIAAGNRYMLYLGKETKPGLVTVKFHLTLNKDLLTKDSEIKLEIYEVLTSTAFVVTKVSENKVVRCISHVNTTHEEIILTTILCSAWTVLGFQYFRVFE